MAQLTVGSNIDFDGTSFISFLYLFISCPYLFCAVSEDNIAIVLDPTFDLFYFLYATEYSASLLIQPSSSSSPSSLPQPYFNSTIFQDNTTTINFINAARIYPGILLVEISMNSTAQNSYFFVYNIYGGILDQMVLNASYFGIRSGIYFLLLSIFSLSCTWFFVVVVIYFLIGGNGVAYASTILNETLFILTWDNSTQKLSYFTLSIGFGSDVVIWNDILYLFFYFYFFILYFYNQVT